ncbi:MAG TPA: hypothetical protein VG096_20830 [Bryobacteraceae bacterium]|jgi:hypothetical protein|nr:hypothetical protein [Bryobacteraceae bacterium]
MSKDHKAQVVTVAVMVVVLAVGVVRKTGWRPSNLRPARITRQSDAPAGQDPQDAIYGMLAAARTGDTKSYLASFSGPMEANLRQTLAERTESDFAKYLRDSQATVKGVAVSDPETTSDGQAKVRVEYIYQDRNEAQTMYLEKGAHGWKINRADSDERVKTLIPYGTPVK